MRTLIVEDNHTNQIVLRSFLSKYGECQVAVNGKQALAAFSAAQKPGDDRCVIIGVEMDDRPDGQKAGVLTSMHFGARTSPAPRISFEIKSDRCFAAHNSPPLLSGRCNRQLTPDFLSRAVALINFMRFQFLSVSNPSDPSRTTASVPLQSIVSGNAEERERNHGEHEHRRSGNDSRVSGRES